MKLTGQVAVVTGATEGIGRAIAQAIASQGADIVLAARTQAKLAGLAKELKLAAPERRVKWVVADVTVSEQVNSLIDSAVETFGKIDILVNNVGRGLRKPLAETTDADWRTLVDQNLSGTFFACRAALPYMLQQKQGLIINIASRAGRVGEAGLAAYCAAKHGVVGLTRALAVEVADYGIRVNAICPGPVSTERMKGLRPDLQPNEWLSPEDVASAVLFLATSPGHTMQGQTLDLF
jgi:NAD(P)-dependent dehydrogenase (short-subunit alcohol dehydrogenase family)